MNNRKQAIRAIQESRGCNYTTALRAYESGRGGNDTPATWDGRPSKNPFTFNVGTEVASHRRHEIALLPYPNIFITGATSSGKTNLAELLAVQTLTYRAPWDPSQCGTVAISDPHGAMKRRWAGREGVLTSAGRDGDEPEETLELLRRMDREMRRRSQVMSMPAHRQAASWMELPDEVKAGEGFAPVLIIMDDYLANLPAHMRRHPDIPGGCAEDVACQEVVALATSLRRQGRPFGVQTCIVAQRCDGTFAKGLLGLAGVMGTRAVTGRISDDQEQAVLGEHAPALPDSYAKFGYARIGNPSSGEAVTTVQVPLLTTEALDRVAPRS